MAAPTLTDCQGALAAVLRSPHGELWSSYDAEADVLNINFKKPARATDSEFTDDDIIVRYEDEEIIGLTILHANKRQSVVAEGH